VKNCLTTLGEELPPAELLSAKRKKQSPDPTKREAAKEEFGRRALAGGNMLDSLSCLLTLLESFDKNNPEMGIDSVARHIHQKTVQHYWVNIVKQQVTGGGGANTQKYVNSANGGGFESNHVSDTGTGTVRQSDYTTQQNAKVKSIINKDRQVAPKRMSLGARLAVNTHIIGGRFVESMKNARWLMSLQEAGDGFGSIAEFQVQIKGHDQQEYEHKWQGWQNWTDEKIATKLTKDNQHPVLLLPARWWPDMLPEFESGGWWQRPHKQVRCRQCKCRNLRMRITVKPEVRNNAMTSILIKPQFFWRLSSQVSFETQKGNTMMRSSKMRLKC